MELGYSDKDLTQLNERELNERQANVVKEIYRQLGNISKELINERSLYPGALYDKGEFIGELQHVIYKFQTDILNFYKSKKS